MSIFPLPSSANPSPRHTAGGTPIAVHVQRIRNISRAMVWACWALISLLPAALVVYWATAADATLAAQGNLLPGDMLAPLQLWQRVAAACVTAVPLALLLTGLWQAKHCFALFAQGQVFTAQAVGCLRRFAGWVAAAALAAIVAAALASILLTLQNPTGLRQLALGISSNHLFTLFFAAMVWLMAAVIGQGQSLAEENERFI
jgi:Protein of unknown function (DUF2975)